MKDYKGTILQFRDADYTNTIVTLTRQLPLIEEVKKAYESLDTTFRFDQTLFENILQNGITIIENQYRVVIQQQIDKLKFTSPSIIKTLKSNISGDLAPLIVKIEALRSAQLRSDGSIIDFSYIKIINGKAIIPEETKDALKEQFTNRVRTDDQNQAYNLLVDLKEKYEALTAFMQERNVNLERWGEIVSDRGNGLCYEQSGKLVIDPDSMSANFLR